MAPRSPFDRTSAKPSRQSGGTYPSHVHARSSRAHPGAAIERLLRLGRGELRLGALLFAYLFLILAATTVGRNSRDGLFLARFSAVQLPFVDLATVLGVTLAAAGYMRLGRFVPLRKLLVESLLTFALTSVAFWWLIHGSAGFSLLLLFYVWIGVLGVLATAQVWTLANYVLTLRQAKRLFPFVGTGSILGSIAGGAVSGVVTRNRGAEILLLGMAAAFAACAMLVPAIGCRFSVSERSSARRSGAVAPAGGLADAARTVVGSPYLRLVATLICIASVAATITGWQWKATAQASMPARQLTAFFGSYTFYTGIVALGIQVLLTGPVLRHVGIGGVLSIVPLALVAGSTGLLVSGSLAAAVILKGSDQVLRYTIDKSATELLYLPVSRTQTFKVKSFLDTILCRLGDAIASVVVLLFARVLGFSPAQLAWPMLVLLVAWLAVARAVHRQYLRNLSDALREHRVNVQGVTTVLDRATTQLLASNLAKGESRPVLNALSLVEASRASHVLPGVESLLAHPSPAVRARALTVLSGSGVKQPNSAVEALLSDPDVRVRSAALEYMAEAGIDPLERVQRAGDFDDVSVRAATVLYLARPARTQNLEACRQILEGMLQETGTSRRRARLEAARLLAHLPKRFDDQLADLLADEDLDVVRHAIRAVGKTRAAKFLPRVIDALAVAPLAADAVAALARFGERVVPRLASCLGDSRIPAEARRELPKALFRIATPAAEQALVDNLTAQDATLRFQVVSALNQLKRRHPEPPLDPAVVEQALVAEIMAHYRSYLAPGTAPREHLSNEDMSRQLECIFRLLQLLLPGRDINSAYVGIQSTDAVVHDKAIELLDNILAPHLRKLLVPLIDSRVERDDRAAIAGRLCAGVR